ncbi:MAG TPA: histidinol-phosphate transaminase [Candidatus Altiarchaeales archaeon]|nr:histidinol-phosphate transaminase [Candidatus Altiarchaeales archaeon]
MEVSDFEKPWIKSLKAYVPGEKIEGCVKLASNENNYGPSPKVTARLKDSLKNIHTYPYKTVEVEKAVAKYAKVKPENIILGNGSDELISLTTLAFKGPALGFTPTFPIYENATRMLGGEYESIPLNPDFSFPLDKFLEKSRKANLLFLCSPNNPSGTVLSEDEVKTVLESGKITVVDEAYFEFCGKSSVKLLKDYPNLIVLRTFAKAFALAGLRVGYGVSSPELIQSLKMVKFPFNVNYLAHEAVLAALDDMDYMNDCVKKIVAGREEISKRLSEKFRIIPSKANFILVDASPMTSQEFYDKMLEQKIVVRKFGKIKGFPGDYVRISVGTDKENKKLTGALEKI